MSEMERVRYDLLLVINTLTFAVVCNSGVWAFLLRAFCPNISCPISGIQPFFASVQNDLEHIVEGTPLHTEGMNCWVVASSYFMH